MLQDTRIALFLLEQLIAAHQANDSDLFKRWLYGGIQDLGEPTFFPTQPIPMPNILDDCVEDALCFHLILRPQLVTQHAEERRSR